jgi:hypothetical protein
MIVLAVLASFVVVALPAAADEASGTPGSPVRVAAQSPKPVAPIEFISPESVTPARPTWHVKNWRLEWQLLSAYQRQFASDAVRSMPAYETGALIGFDFAF